jgi:hypothetical protein
MASSKTATKARLSCEWKAEYSHFVHVPPAGRRDCTLHVAAQDQ